MSSPDTAGTFSARALIYGPLFVDNLCQVVASISLDGVCVVKVGVSELSNYYLDAVNRLIQWP
jgi:hypothetical protein